MSKKYYVVHALYKDDDVLMDAVKTVRDAQYHIDEVYTPFPVHVLDKAIGLKPTRIAITSFLYGPVGLLTAVFLTNYTMNVDWPQDFGGKPSFSFSENMLAFVTIMFELTVFYAAHLMVITFYLRSRLWPWKKAENPYPSSTDDTFVMEFEVEEKVDDLKNLLSQTGAVEINVIEKTDEDHE
jgi:hypothetical protein